MKLHENNRENGSVNYCREFYHGCYIEAISPVDGATWVGIVLKVEPDEIAAIMVAEPEDDWEFPHQGVYWDMKVFEDKTFRRISREKYMLYKLKGFNLPMEPK